MRSFLDILPMLVLSMCRCFRSRLILSTRTRKSGGTPDGRMDLAMHWNRWLQRRSRNLKRRCLLGWHKRRKHMAFTRRCASSTFLRFTFKHFTDTKVPHRHAMYLLDDRKRLASDYSKLSQSFLVNDVKCRSYTDLGIFRTFRALRTIWRSFLPQDALSKRARENSVTTYGTA